MVRAVRSGYASGTQPGGDHDVAQVAAGRVVERAAAGDQAEFRVGPEMSNQRERELERVERALASVVILEFTADAARRYAIIKAAMLKRGRPVGDCDTIIASVALTNGQSLLTRNPTHFAEISGLVVESY